jgi:hypothetical protein
MQYFIINRDTLRTEKTYELADGETSGWIPRLSEPNCIHLPLPENIDSTCIKAVLIDEVITLVEDADKVAAKAQAAKDAQIAVLRAQCDADIEASQFVVYGTKNQSAALATQQSWSDIEANPAMYVPLMFPTLEDATFWITPRMAAARMFAAWRFQRIVTRDTEIAAL